jgi:serine/threonine protein kinase
MAPVDRAIDVWSLGCVLSVAATWVVLGDKGIPLFQKMRMQAIKAIKLQRPSQTGRGPPKLEHGDYFHDSKEVLEVVPLWHRYLRSVSRKTDIITGHVLDVVDQKMLCGDPADRITAENLCSCLRRISSSSTTTPEDSLPETFKKALLEVDNLATSKPVASAIRDKSQGLHSSFFGDGSSRKSKLLDLPLMKTAHRSEYRGSHLSTTTAVARSEDILSESPVQIRPTGADLRHFSQSEVLRHQEQAPPGGHFAAGSSPVVPGRSELSPSAARPPGFSTGSDQRSTPNQRKPENIFQARRALHKRQGSQKLISKIFKRTQKDEFLMRYFGNRDIVSHSYYYVSLLCGLYLYATEISGRQC